MTTSVSESFRAVSDPRGGIASQLFWEPSSRTEAGRQVAAVVIDRDGAVLGAQTKNQLDPTEDAPYVPGNTRQLFEVDGVKFGIAICHEGFRYPETVRWAATRGARVVFHPHLTGSDRQGLRLERWGDPAAPYYEQATRLRALENTIYFASVNYALRFGIGDERHSTGRRVRRSCPAGASGPKSIPGCDR